MIYYPAFNQPNVKPIDVSATQGVEAMTDKGFVRPTVTGRHEVDCIICLRLEVTKDPAAAGAFRGGTRQ